MPRFWNTRSFRFGRACFRWLRLACWLVLLAVLCALVYLNQVGLPGFLKGHIVAELHSVGIEFEYADMHLDFYGGIVAEQVRVGSVSNVNSPAFSAERVSLQLNPDKLYRFRRIEVDSLIVQGGSVSLPVGLTNGPRTNLVVEGIEGRLLLLPGDVWNVQDFRARALGGRIELSGTISNASVLGLWDLESGKGRGQAAWREYLRHAVETANRMKFNSLPELKGRVKFDAADPMGAQAKLELVADGAQTPWGDARQFELRVTSLPATNKDEILGASVEMRLVGASTRWGEAPALTIRTRTRPVETPGAWPGGGLVVEAVQPKTRWGSAAELRLDFTMSDVQTNLTGIQGRVQLDLREPRTPWVSAEKISLTAQAGQLPATAVVATDATWGWWADLAPYELDWRLAAEKVSTTKADLDRVTAAGHWRAPQLAVDALELELLGGRLRGTARADVGTRAVTAGAGIDFDVKKLDRLLSPGALRWLEQFSWDQPPVARAEASAQLPPWTAAHIDWEREVLPTLRLAGTLTNQTGAYRGVEFERASVDFSFTNDVWFIRNVVVDRPEGTVWLEHDSNERSRDYSFKLRSTIDVRAIRPWLDEGSQRALDYFQFTQSPEIEAELAGRWRAPDRTGVSARLHATNFTFRGETASDLRVDVQFTNGIVTFQNARFIRPEGEATVAAGRFDIGREELLLTNALSTVEVGSVLRPIGPLTAATMAPYQFLAPPRVTVNGLVHTGDTAKMDLRFHVEGGPFRWECFNLPTLAADLHWVHNGLLMSNVTAGFYDGKISGGGQFSFAPREGTEFSFGLNVWESDLRKLMTDITGKTNQLEGVLNGQLNVFRARSWDWKSWQGYGNASLRDGLIWDVPLFGFLTTPLNMVNPSLGNSRASDARATFTITNSVIHTSDLEILAETLRLSYRGTVDFDTRVDARVDAELLRDTGILGRVVNIALFPLAKLFEYRVTGTLAEPKPEPLYILPRILLAPMKSWKEMTKPSAADAPADATPPAPVPMP